MKKFIILSVLAIMVSSCQFLFTHPELLVGAEVIAEEIYDDYAQSKNKTLSPTPPMKVNYEKGVK